MKKLIIVTAIIMLVSCATVKQSAPPVEETSAGAAISNALTEAAEDQDYLILATLWFQKSAEMRALYYQCFRNAETALAENLAMQIRKMPIMDLPASENPMSGQGKPAAVVLDIDETLLDNSPFQGWQVLEKKEFNNDDWFRWVELAQAKSRAGCRGIHQVCRFTGSGGVLCLQQDRAGNGPDYLKIWPLFGFANADSTHIAPEGDNLFESGEAGTD